MASKPSTGKMMKDDEHMHNASEISIPSSHGSQALLEKLKTTEESKKNVKDPYLDLDERRKEIYNDVKKKFKKSPKPLQQSANENKMGLEKQLEYNEKHLNDLIQFGDDLVNNVKIANEKREVLRKQHGLARKSDLTNRVKNESIQALAQFDEISSRWVELEVLKEPMALYENMNKQKERIAALMKNKDNIIEQCQKEMNDISQKYYDDQEKQSYDICYLIERIDNQIELIKNAYKEHVRLLEDTIENERQLIALNSSEKWNDFYDIVSKNEENKFAKCKERETFYANQIDRIIANQEEITRSTRIRLEKDAETLEWELRKVKYNVLMNSEKLDYNYQVLQKRNEENVIINNQQKRRVAKLHEAVSVLKKKIHIHSSNAHVTIHKLSTDIQKLHSSISELERKSQQFQLNNKKKFDSVWEINYKEIKELLLKVFDIDKIIYEQQLIVPWEMPHLHLEDINKQEDSVRLPQKQKEMQKATKTICQETKQEEIRFLRNILRHIADRAGFLVEEKLLKILKPYKEEEQYLVKIDNIFTALRINDIKIVKSLSDYFKPYAWCPNCSKEAEMKTIEERLHKQTDTCNEMNGKLECTNHNFVIEPTHVMTALNDFVKNVLNIKLSSLDYTNYNQKTVNLINIENNDIKIFWEKLASYVPPEKQKLWCTLEHGLNHYIEVLKQRDELNNECIFLRKQNVELNHLLKKFTA